MTEHVQAMRVGNGVLIAIPRAMRQDETEAFRRAWDDLFPDVPVAFLANAVIVERDGQPFMLDFGAEVTSDAFEEFKRWWEEVSHV